MESKELVRHNDLLMFCLIVFILLVFKGGKCCSIVENNILLN